MTDNEEKSAVAYWIVEQYQLAREEFRIVAIFNHELAAREHAELINRQAEAAIVGGVRSFEQLVDCLVRERFYPLAPLIPTSLRDALEMAEARRRAALAR